MRRFSFLIVFFLALFLYGCGGNSHDPANITVSFPSDVPEFFHCELVSSEQKGADLFYHYDTCTTSGLVDYRYELEDKGWVITHIRPRTKDYLVSQDPPLQAIQGGSQLLISNDKYILELTRYTSRRNTNARIRISEVIESSF